MFKQFKKIDNESGVVLFIVLMVAIIIMIFSVGILSQSVNELNYAQDQIDQMTCDQLKTGYLWNAYINQGFTSGNTQLVAINGREYTVTMTNADNGAGITNWQFNCSYSSVE